jgi:hypothetical protein
MHVYDYSCSGAEDAVQCLELDLSGNTACLSLGEPTKNDNGKDQCVPFRDCRTCAEGILIGFGNQMVFEFRCLVCSVDLHLVWRC